MNKNGQIQLILGPMFSGKTTELIRRIKRYESANHKCMVIKYARDVRYDSDETSTNSIITHDRNCLNATVKATVLDDIELFTNNYSVIGIDEGQFFKDVIEFSEKMANLGKIVIVAALDGTFERQAFGDILHLVPLAENVTKLSAVCKICFKDASFTKRIGSERQVELIGGTECYLAVCRQCFHNSPKKIKHTTKEVTSQSGCKKISDMTNADNKENCETNMFVYENKVS